MKLFSSAIILFTFFFVFIDGRPFFGAEIKTKWGIDDPTTVYDSGNNTFIMTFPGTSAGGTDGIEDPNLRVPYYDKNYKDSNPDNVYEFGVNGVGGVTSIASPIIIDGESVVKFQLNTDVLAQDNKIYDPPSTANDNKGEMEICTRMSVGYIDATSKFQEVNFIETIITIKYDLKDDINLSEFNVAPSSEFDISIGVSKLDNNNDGVGALRTATARFF